MVHLPTLKTVLPGIVMAFDSNAIQIAWYDIVSQIWQWNSYAFWEWD